MSRQKQNYSDFNFYEIVKRNNRTREDIQILPKAVKGRTAAQAVVDRLQRALETANPDAKRLGFEWMFRPASRERART